ncbi:MAG: hypothetical protein ACRD4B_02970, partial [Acidobacteriota bacterium]
MNIILLGGNNIGNKQWLDNITIAFTPHFDSLYVHQYRHWTTGEELIDIDLELSELSKKLPTKPYMIAAKSAGVLLALKGIQEQVLAPQKCIFFGTPIPWAKKNNFETDKWVQQYTVPTLFIQQTHDPILPFNDLQDYLQQTNIKNHQLF